MALRFRSIKLGMTQIFEASGEMVPCTVLQFSPNVVCQVKSEEKDGYKAVVLASGNLSKNKRLHPQVKFFGKINVQPGYLHEFRVDEGMDAAFEVGHAFTVDSISSWEFLDVTSVSKGKGFAGSIKKLRHSRGPKSHGSKHYRLRGSLGCRTTPGRVFKNKGMPSHMGCETKTVQSLKVVRVDTERNVVLVKGQVPGGVGSPVFLCQAIKKKV